MDSPPPDYSDEVRKHRSFTVRVVLVVVGSGFVVLGIVGVFTPVLPTTPFLLVAAGCYARASTRFYNALLRQPTFGPLIREWQRHRSIPYRTKLLAIAMMAVSLSVSIVFFVKPPWLQGALAVMGAGLAVWMYRIPSRDHPAPPRR